MPTSLMFVALVGAWLVVLVPMVARRRQQVVRTADSALNARVLRRGGSAQAPARRASGMAMRSHTVGATSSTRVRKVCAVSDSEFDEYDEYDEYDEEELEAAYEAETTGGGWVRERDHRRPAAHTDEDIAESDDDYDAAGYADEAGGGAARGRYVDIPAARVSDDEPDAYGQDTAVDDDAAEAEPADVAHDQPEMDEAEFDDGAAPVGRRAERAGGASRPYRPGRGGFDPEVAELTARARYSFRQRIVVVLLLTAVGTGLAAGIVLPTLWWVHGCLDLVLVGYLAYLRRQVRIEEGIRQRRMARLASSRRPVAAERPAAGTVGERRSADGESDDAEAGERGSGGLGSGERRSAERVPARRPVPRAASAVVRHPGAARVELDDEDPVFDELAEPAPVSYRRAVGE